MSSNTKSTNPYAPPKREWNEKHWLYKQYWGEVKTVAEIATSVDVSRQTILRTMDEKGIPRRPPTADCDDPHDVAQSYKRGKRDVDPPYEEPSTTAYSWTEVSDAALDD